MAGIPDAARDDKRASTGIGGLDRILGGGLPQGHLFLVEGEPGSGKTTMGLQFLLAGAAAGEPTMYVTLSESMFELRKVASSHHFSLDAISVFEYTPKEDSLRAEDQYSAFHPSEVEFTDITKSILDNIERVKPVRVVFDSLSEIRLLARDSLRYRRQILALKHFFGNRCCYCDTELAPGLVAQDHLIPMNKTGLGLHAWGNVVPACGPCNAKKQGGDWRDFIIERAGPHAAERHARMKAFLDHYKYAPTHDLREVAEELYEEVGAIAMTLIESKVKRVRAKL